ncbi:MAG: hypothetical protein ACYTFG_04110 [Planctomycetota bacterium]
MTRHKLNCSLCGEMYESEDPFPVHQVCPRCLAPGGVAPPPKTGKKSSDPDQRKKERKKKKQARKNKRKNRKK